MITGRIVGEMERIRPGLTGLGEAAEMITGRIVRTFARIRIVVTRIFPGNQEAAE